MTMSADEVRIEAGPGSSWWRVVAAFGFDERDGRESTELNLVHFPGLSRR
jgi:hypothetical protein